MVESRGSQYDLRTLTTAFYSGQWEAALIVDCPVSSKVEICRDQWSCKICASCVNFPGNQCDVSHNLRRTTRFTHTKCDLALKLLQNFSV